MLRLYVGFARRPTKNIPPRSMNRNDFAGGRGIDKDDAEAVRWFRKAAEKGHPDARTELQKRDSQHEATTHPVKQVDLAQSMKSYGGVAILYAFSVRVIDERNVIFAQRIDN